MKFEANSNLKTSSTISQSDSFFSILSSLISPVTGTKTFSGFFQHHLMCHMNDCLEQIEKSFIKTE
jgi:hypothetical protein